MSSNNNYKGKKPNKSNSKDAAKDEAYDKTYKNNNNRSKRNYRNDSYATRVPKSIGALDGGMNDFSWYNHYPALTDSSCRMNFSQVMGYPVSANIEAVLGERSPASVAMDHFMVPGIMTIPIIPTVGSTTQFNSTLNTAAVNLYSYVRHANAGHSNYDVPDLMLYLLSLDSIYSYYSWMVRLYGMCSTYSYVNRYLPTGLLSASGLSVSGITDVLSNLASFRTYINNFAVKMGSFAVPSNIDYFNRHQWLFSNVFKDDANERASLYMFIPKCFYEYEELDDAGYCRAIPAMTNIISLSNITTYGDSMLKKLMASEDVGIISGDILKAFNGNIFTASALPEIYNVVPVFNEMVLEQIHNATLFPIQNVFDAPVGHKWDVTQVVNPSGNYLVQDPYVQLGVLSDRGADFVSAYAGGRLLSSESNDPNPEFIMEATRLMSIPTYEQSDDADPIMSLRWDSLHPFPTEVCCSATIYKVSGNPASGTYIAVPDVIYYTQFDSTHDALLALGVFSELSCFDKHPFVMMGTKVGGINFPAVRNYEVDNYTMLNASDLKTIHDVALISLFEIPNMGEFSTKLK